MSSRNERYYRAWLSHRQISRRGLLRSVLRAGRPEPAPAVRQAARPPQAQPDALFLARCDGCGACVAACPLGMIKVSGGKAELDPETAFCDGCLICTAACPTDALAPDCNKETGLRPIMREYCFGRTTGGCQLCVMACPSSAIFFNQENHPALSEARCWGCGACKFACYHGHIQLALSKQAFNKN